MTQAAGKQLTDSTTKSLPGKPVPKLVLDTNIVLDWLVFADPSMHQLAAAVHLEQIVLFTHALALDELQRVLGYAALRLDATRQTSALTKYRKHAHEIAPPVGFSPQNLMLPAGFPRCKDPDDQHFLALALHAGADALVTRDNAILALRKQVRKFGVTIIDVQQLIALLNPAS